MHLDSVFQFGIGWYFLGILPTETKGKLGKDFLVLCLGRNVPINDPEGLLLVVNGAMYDYGNDAAFHLEGNNLYWHGGFTLEITDRIYLKYLTLKKQP